MRSILAFVLLLISISAFSQSELIVITYNIRLNTSSDGEHAWPNRKADVAALFRFHEAEIFCVQEALPEQMDDLTAALPEFSYEGVGRDDGKREGEFSAVFYRSDRFKKLDGGTFWLSETPSECSFGWDAACRRVCSWVKLKDKTSGEQFFVFNTHFDHVGVEARKNSAKLILSKIHELAGTSPVILCGDFNLPPDAEPIALIREKLADSHDVTLTPPYGETATFHGFTFNDPLQQRIDYLFVSPGIKVLKYGILTDSRAGSFFSDHLPVVVRLSI